MFEMSWITAILQLYSQVTDLFGNVIVKRINTRLFDLLARFHYILNLPRNTYQLTHILLNNFPRVTNLVSTQYSDIVLLSYGQI